MASARSVTLTLLPIMAAVSAGFIVIGVALPVLPLHVHDDLGFGTVVVGLVAGSQFAASLFSRVWAGSFADRRGPKRGVAVGLLGAAAAGVLYLASLAFTDAPVISVAVLLVGRAVLGAAESFIITGGVSWAMGWSSPVRPARSLPGSGQPCFSRWQWADRSVPCFSRPRVLSLSHG